MHTPKPAAALSSGLLARKGLAQPAMRRQPVIMDGMGPRAVTAFDDLGWNDMGEDASAPIPSIHPSPVAQHIAAIQDILALRKAEAEAKSPEPKLTPLTAKTVAPGPIAVRESKVTGKSAFTLRIDAERHLRLRLLSAVINESAQSLLIGALDALIAQHPDIDALAADPKARRGMDETGMEQGKRP
ncbi:hypothetical protein BH10PSE13_BH10PSE13_19340 [soil metagenome]